MRTDRPSSLPPRPHAQASAIRARHAFVVERFGADGEARLLEAASPALRAVLGGMEPPGGWADFTAFVEVNVLVDRLFGSGDLWLVRELGRDAARRNAGVWRSLFEKGVDVPKFVEIAGGLWHKHYDVGSVERTIVADDGVRLEIRGMPEPHRAHCWSVAGWLEGVFEFKPGMRVGVQELSCRATGAATCEMLLRWS
jgi:predicted hydrocarbon binding protein